MTERSGVEIDYCPKCRGVWLDRGELDKLIERAAGTDEPSVASGAPPVPPMASQPQPYAQQPYPPQPIPQPMPQGQYRRRDDDSADDDPEEFYRRQQQRGGYQQHPQQYPRKKKSWLGEILDFD